MYEPTDKLSTLMVIGTSEIHVSEAFSTLSEDDRQTIMAHFKDMKTQYAELSEEEHSAKHAEMKQQMEAFMGLSLDEKISYLKYMAMSLRN